MPAAISSIGLCAQLQPCGTDTKVVYRRYASLFFVCGVGVNDNELVTLEIIHRYVEVLDRYFGNVSKTTEFVGFVSDKG